MWDDSSLVTVQFGRTGAHYCDDDYFFRVLRIPRDDCYDFVWPRVQVVIAFDRIRKDSGCVSIL